MKTCPKCGAQVADDAGFCTVCGFNFNAAGAATGAPQGAPQPQPQPQFQQAPVAPSYAQYAPVNPCDKLLGILAMFSCLSPLGGFFGFIFAWFGGEYNGQRSDYLKFYSNQAMVFALFSLIDTFFGWIPVIGWAWVIFRFVCVIIAIVNACKGLTKPVLFFGTIKVVK